jgi:hypothetical protein
MTEDDRYLEDDWRSDDFVREQMATWSEPDLRLLHARLRALSLAGWLEWLETHTADAARQLATTPGRSKRRAATAPATQSESLLARYGALWLAQLGRLAALPLDFPNYQRGSGTPREVRVARGRLVVELAALLPCPWPWSTPPDLRNPFCADDS